MSRVSESTKLPAAPPTKTAPTPAPSRTPPASMINWRSVVPNGTSYSPGRVTSPEMQKSLGPVERSVPIAANSDAPISSTASTATSVSMLFTEVGLPNTPFSVGKGGFCLGSPR